MRVAVVGAGAIGSVVGGLLAESGHTVAMVGRGLHLAAMAAAGLRIVGIWGDHKISGFSAYTHVRDIAETDWDLVVISTKSFDTATAIDDADPLVGPRTLVLSLQNGLGNVEQIEARFGTCRALGGMAIFGAKLVEPGTVEVTVIASETRIGSRSGDVAADRVERVVTAFYEAGIPTLATDAIDSHIWEKVVYNCALNPLSAVLGVPYGVLAETVFTRNIMRRVIDETYAVANAKRVRMFCATADEYYRHFLDDKVPPTAAHKASMYEDLRLGRRTEIDALNGMVVKLGSDLGIPCPVNRTLVRLVKASECARRAGGS
ncbi:MAG: ketopantoate reductase family protein [Candidatus Hydrogenedentes bacterium]|nr:ketopantoate reductase family protein [Candidatus Hydrogenedentota bacterium]